jgi:RNA polymerase I-specific transcription initiation factor RRN7
MIKKSHSHCLVDVYDTVKTLQQLVDFGFTYPSMPESQKRSDSLKLPEVQLVVLLIISTKLIFPFDDDVKRYAASYSEPATQTMDWSRWAYNQNWFEHLSMVQDDKLDKETLIRVNDHDIFKMEPDQLDQYMDWYESSWLDSYRAKHPVADLFSPSRPEPQAQSESESADPSEALERVIKSVMVALGPALVNSSEDADRYRPGSWYRRYRWESQLPETARKFYEIAADLASISLSTLVRAVSVTEWRIAKWLEDERREAYMAKWGVAEVDDGDDTQMDEPEGTPETEAKDGA